MRLKTNAFLPPANSRLSPASSLCSLCSPHPPPRSAQGSKGQALETQGEKLIVSPYKRRKKSTHHTASFLPLRLECLERFAVSAWHALMLSAQGRQRSLCSIVKVVDWQSDSIRSAYQPMARQCPNPQAGSSAQSTSINKSTINL